MKRQEKRHERPRARRRHSVHRARRRHSVRRARPLLHQGCSRGCQLYAHSRMEYLLLSCKLISKKYNSFLGRDIMLIFLNFNNKYIYPLMNALSAASTRITFNMGCPKYFVKSIRTLHLHCENYKRNNFLLSI